MATETKIERGDRAAEAADKYVTLVLLWSAFAWVACWGAVLMHVAGVGSTAADIAALGLSLIVGVAWSVVLFLANW